MILSEIKNQLNIKSDEELVNNNDVKYFFGLPVQNENNEIPEDWRSHSDVSNKVYGCPCVDLVHQRENQKIMFYIFQILRSKTHIFSVKVKLLVKFVVIAKIHINLIKLV